jgi:hypothetical protein
MPSSHRWHHKFKGVIDGEGAIGKLMLGQERHEIIRNIQEHHRNNA